jgi:hypothetical protein
MSAQPGRAEISMEDDASAVGAALRSDAEICRSATQPGFAILGCGVQSCPRTFVLGYGAEKLRQKSVYPHVKSAREPHHRIVRVHVIYILRRQELVLR